MTVLRCSPHQCLQLGERCDAFDVDGTEGCKPTGVCDWCGVWGNLTAADTDGLFVYVVLRAVMMTRNVCLSDVTVTPTQHGTARHGTTRSDNDNVVDGTTGLCNASTNTTARRVACLSLADRFTSGPGGRACQGLPSAGASNTCYHRQPGCGAGN